VFLPEVGLTMRPSRAMARTVVVTGCRSGTIGG
jgi:hypothetical protein